MFKNRSLAFNLSFSIVLVTTVVMGLIYGYGSWRARAMLLEDGREIAENLSLATANQLDQVFMRAELGARTLATRLESGACSEEELIQFQKLMVEGNPEIYGCCAAFEPKTFDPGSVYFAPYVFRDGQALKTIKIGKDTYQYFHMNWYQVPKLLGEPVWSEPYFDEGGGDILMSTYSVPFYRTVDGKRTFWGIATVDISLDWLRNIVRSIKIYDHGYAFLISRDGCFVTHPDPHLVMNESVFSVAEEMGSKTLRRIGREMINGGSGFTRFVSIALGQPGYLGYVPLRSTQWSLAVFFPEDELFAKWVSLRRLVIVFAVIGLVALLVVVVVVSRTITRPLRTLAGAAETIGHGDFNDPLPDLKGCEELAKLRGSFENMRVALVAHIANLRETTAIKEKIESELRIAHDIQMGIIPKLFPPYPHLKELDLYASLEPAREVGGDLYDFFLMNDDTLCFVVGDVSGKGVPASLFMAVTRTLFRAKAAAGMTAGEIVAALNDDLSQDNESCMFVTFFLGILDIPSGRVEYANAGHNPPYVIRSESGGVERIDQRHGVPLGMFSESEYGFDSLTLRAGDVFVLYTDGVTEAMDVDERLFEEERLEATLAKSKGLSPKEVIERIENDLDGFVGDAEQADDITMLALSYHGE